MIQTTNDDEKIDEKIEMGAAIRLI